MPEGVSFNAPAIGSPSEASVLAFFLKLLSCCFVFFWLGLVLLGGDFYPFLSSFWRFSFVCVFFFLVWRLWLRSTAFFGGKRIACL